MKSNCRLEKKERYLYFVITGEYNKQEFLLYPKMVLDECAKEKIYRVLFNGLAVTGTDVPTMDRFFVGEEVARTLGYKIKVAVVWPEAHINKFAENVAVNRGGNFCVLGNIDAAEKWLLTTN